MPYKDLEKRRTYQRDYKRQKRARAKLLKMECQTCQTPKRPVKPGGQTQGEKPMYAPSFQATAFPA